MNRIGIYLRGHAPWVIVKLMPRRKRIALIAHDNCKTEMLEWARFNRDTLATHELHATARRRVGPLAPDDLGGLALF